MGGNALPPDAQGEGPGALNAIVLEEGFEAWDACMSLRDRGLLAKQTHGNIVRFAPPLVIAESEMAEALGIIEATLAAL